MKRTGYNYKLISPCKDCEERCIGCHGKCVKYLAFRLTLASEKQEKKNRFSEIERYYGSKAIKEKNRYEH